MMDKIWYSPGIGVNEQHHLTFGGQDTVLLAEKYGTPLYLMDEDRIRQNCRIYREAFEDLMPAGSRVAYASKAASCKAILRMIAEEGLCVDVASAGELYTAAQAGFDMEKVFFHGNSKTDAEIRFAMEQRVGWFVIDNREEAYAIRQEAAARGIRQKVLLRITPGIDPHTYAYISTGQVDSKFGIALETGQAEALTLEILQMPELDLRGFHCHIGSQVFTEDVFERSAVVMLQYIAHIREISGYCPEILDLGGGYGVRYVGRDPVLNIREKVSNVAQAVRETCDALQLTLPSIVMEPGRGIVADTGMTLYTVQNVKNIPGYRTYVSVNGGMTDNPRPALYGAEYTVLAADMADTPCDMECSVVGHCCESDLLQEGAHLPKEIRRGNLLGFSVTGAYHYSMASNYNRYPRPAMVLLKDGGNRVAVRRETLEDLLRLDED